MCSFPSLVFLPSFQELTLVLNSLGASGKKAKRLQGKLAHRDLTLENYNLDML